jgi:ATP-dependent DNA ligase
MNHQAIRKGTEPAFIEPMQCKPVTALPADEKWTYEIKLDGYRCIAVKRARDVTLFSRHKKVLNGRFPGVVETLASLDGDFVLDGELIALDSQGKPSFQLLQNSLSQSLQKLPKSEVTGKKQKVSVNSREAERRSCGLT